MLGIQRAAACCCMLCCHLQIRDLYMTFRNFKARIADFLRFRWVAGSCAAIAGCRSRAVVLVVLIIACRVEML